MVASLYFGAPGRIRTSDRLVRSQVLYPTELRARGQLQVTKYDPGIQLRQLNRGVRTALFPDRCKQTF